MPRYVKGDRFQKRAQKQLTVSDLDRAERFLEKLARNPPPADINLKPMEGFGREIWEMKAGGQNRFILRLARDDVGTYFVVEDVGPHDIYATWNAKRR